jgi:Heterokaryon incompatibility protein (HET)
MRRIFETAKTVVIWLGPDNEVHQAPLAIDSVRQITHFLCRKLGISFEDLTSKEEVYHEVIFKGKGQIPLPHECDFVTEEMWESLRWLYKHPYFTRLWVIQEINASKHRMAHCGHEIIPWVAIELVAGYIILETTFSKSQGFTNTFCWWASTAPSVLRQAKNWLHMLYLASNFAATDPRDVIYGLRGMMRSAEGGWLLDPDYSKSTLQVYRDSVEAAFIDYKTTDALLYVSGVEDPSWVPRWDQPMLFRNPFRFSKPVPWKPAGESPPVWRIDKDANVLSMSGFVHDSIEFVEPYHETFFGSTMIASDEGRLELKSAWHRILSTMTKALSHIPFKNSILAATANSFSFGIPRTSAYYFTTLSLT